MFTEETHGADATRVHLVHQRLSVFGQTRSEDDHFVVFLHFLEEVLDAGPLLDEDIADRAFDVDRDDKVRILDLIELTVDQSFIQIQNQRLHTFAPFRRRSKHPVELSLAVVLVSRHTSSLGLRAVLRSLVRVHLGNLSNLALGHLCNHRFQLLLYFFTCQTILYRN